MFYTNFLHGSRLDIFFSAQRVDNTYYIHVANHLDRLNRDEINICYIRAELHFIMENLKSIGEARHVLNKRLSSTLMNVSFFKFYPGAFLIIHCG